MFGADTGAALFPVPGQVVPVREVSGRSHLWEPHSQASDSKCSVFLFLNLCDVIESRLP